MPDYPNRRTPFLLPVSREKGGLRLLGFGEFEASIHGSRRISGFRTGVRLPMLSDLANLVTAIATAITAVLLLLEYRSRSRQVVKAYRDLPKDGWAMVRIHVFPTEAPTRVIEISTRQPVLSGIKWDTISYGAQQGARTHEPPVSSLPVAIDVDSCRVEEAATVIPVFVCLNDVNSSEIVITLRCKRRLVPYTLKASIRTNK